MILSSHTAWLKIIICKEKNNEQDEFPNDMNSRLEELCHSVDIIVVKNHNEMSQFKLSQLLEFLKRNSYHYKVYYLDISLEQGK